jgi:3-oxoacyl-[acyl-carrier-protein] synthase-3
MGACIEAATTAVPRHRLLPAGARRLSDTAARRCLARAHHASGELDLLVNIGIYKDHAIAEPALASIIQEDVGAGLGHPLEPGRHGTFSFDLLDGGCGLVTAARLLDGLVGHGPARRALIVAGDAEPWPRRSRGVPFAPAGGAVLLARDEATPGFVRFATRTFPEEADAFTAFLHWDRAIRRNVLEVHEAADLAERAAAHGAAVARALLDDAGWTAPDLLIASQLPHDFDLALARALALPATCVPRVDPHLARAHTAGPIAALEAAIDGGMFARARRVLFVTAGAGLTIAAALYEGRP